MSHEHQVIWGALEISNSEAAEDPRQSRERKLRDCRRNDIARLQASACYVMFQAGAAAQAPQAAQDRQDARSLSASNDTTQSTFSVDDPTSDDDERGDEEYKKFRERVPDDFKGDNQDARNARPYCNIQWPGFTFESLTEDDQQAVMKMVSEAGESQVSWSAGSYKHLDKRCRPCHYVHTPVGCVNGQECLFCHLPHDKKSRPRPCKSKRIQCKQFLNMLEETQTVDPEKFKEVVDTIPDRSMYLQTMFKKRLKAPKGSSSTPRPLLVGAVGSGDSELCSPADGEVQPLATPKKKHLVSL